MTANWKEQNILLTIDIILFHAPLSYLHTHSHSPPTLPPLMDCRVLKKQWNCNHAFHQPAWEGKGRAKAKGQGYWVGREFGHGQGVKFSSRGRQNKVPAFKTASHHFLKFDSIESNRTQPRGHRRVLQPCSTHAACSYLSFGTNQPSWVPTVAENRPKPWRGRQNEVLAFKTAPHHFLKFVSIESNRTRPPRRRRVLQPCTTSAACSYLSFGTSQPSWVPTVAENRQKPWRVFPATDSAPIPFAMLLLLLLLWHWCSCGMLWLWSVVSGGWTWMDPASSKRLEGRQGFSKFIKLHFVNTIFSLPYYKIPTTKLYAFLMYNTYQY